MEKRLVRVEMLAQWGGLSSLRQFLEGAELAPGNQRTLDLLRDLARRPLVSREPLPIEVQEHVPNSPFDLDETVLLRDDRSARRGAAAGPSGMTT